MLVAFSVLKKSMNSGSTLCRPVTMATVSGKKATIAVMMMRGVAL